MLTFIRLSPRDLSQAITISFQRLLNKKSVSSFHLPVKFLPLKVVLKAVIPQTRLREEEMSYPKEWNKLLRTFSRTKQDQSKPGLENNKPSIQKKKKKLIKLMKKTEKLCCLQVPFLRAKSRITWLTSKKNLKRSRLCMTSMQICCLDVKTSTPEMIYL